MCHTVDCGCGQHAYVTSGGCHHHQGCCASGRVMRLFPTTEETISQLEEYLGGLRAEAKGVEEHLERLRKGEH